MSAVATQPPGYIDLSHTSRVPFSRLVQVEVRKMVDTRAGLWLMMSTGVLLGLAVALTLLVVLLNDMRITADGWFQVLLIPLSLLLPVFPILAVTSEWSQRTGLVSFALEPVRIRVVVAKLVATVLLALTTVVVAAVVGVVGNLLFGVLSDFGMDWGLSGSTVVWSLVPQLLYFLMAFAIGSLLLNTPGAIALYYVFALLVPFMVYGFLYSVFEWAQDLIPWIDMGYATGPLANGQPFTATAAGQVLLSTLIWVVIPGALGIRRVLRAEVK